MDNLKDKMSNIKEFKDYIPPSWDVLFMRKVYEIASKSKDPRTKIGAVLVIDKQDPLSGYNGIPRHVKDLPARMERPEKYNWMEHAERNIINMAAKKGISTDGGTLYTQGIPCSDCMRGVINCGIIEIVLHKQWEDISTKITNKGTWRDFYHVSSTMANEAGIKIRILDQVIDKLGYLDGKVFKV